MNKFTLELVESELKIILEALISMEKKMAVTCDQSKDEDEIADIGNDLIEVRLLLNPLKENAIKEFGTNIINFSHDLL